MKLPLKFLTGLFALTCFASSAFAADASSFKPPAGSRVAIVVFEDLECPTCARAYPAVWDAAKAHNVPVVLHDFPLPNHAWSFDAAIYARFFDTKSEKTGNDFRAYIYKNQINITKQNLRTFVQRFSDENKIPLPFVVDPDGKLKAGIRADYDLGTSIGMQHTPTIFVVSATSPFVEVPDQALTDRAQLGQLIEDMQKKTGPATPAKAATTKGKPAAKKKS
jgi:thiol-disulfide isomerase/thioredoxin